MQTNLYTPVTNTYQGVSWGELVGVFAVFFVAALIWGWLLLIEPAR